MLTNCVIHPHYNFPCHFKVWLHVNLFPSLQYRILSLLPFLMHFLLFSLSLLLSSLCVPHVHCCWPFLFVSSVLSIPHFTPSSFSSMLFSPHPLLALSSSLWSPQFTLNLSLSPLTFPPLNHVSLPVDISVSLLAVLVGFCGLALLVVSLFVFWKLCWPIWRSKALSSHSETVPQGVLPEAPAPTPHVTPSLPERQAIQAEKQEKKEEEEDQRRKVPEVKVNGRSSVKSLEAAMKISQTSPDIPAEVQQTIRERLSKKAKIQKQSTEPTSFSRYPAPPSFSHKLLFIGTHIALLSSPGSLNTS